MRHKSGLLALLAAVGAITYHSFSASTSTEPAAPGALAPGLTHSAAGDLANTLTAFDRRRIFKIDFRKRHCIIAETASDVSYRSLEPALGFEWVVAILPDPQSSNMKLDFDRNLEMIQLAARNAEYQFERFWLPWGDGAVNHTPGSGGKQKTGIATDDTQGDGADDLPGLLLFRNESSKPLAVFLVSESPTGGVAGNKFRTAVRLGRALASLDGTKPDDQLRIIGPGFSGSLAPLSTLILTERYPFEGVALHTWTTNPDAQKQFEAAFKGSRLEPKLGKEEIDARTTIAAFIQYVKANWREKAPFVILSEEGTVFGGQNFANSVPDKKAPVWTIPFPRNLSQLRNATEKQEHLPGFGDDSRQNNVPRDGLIMSLRQDSTAKLEVPIFSKEQTPLSQESVLFTISSLLKTGTIHYVGVIATDPLDTLFLARYLRSACPNVRVFTPNPDLMFEHGSDSSDFSGIIGISTYPLFPFSQIWSGARDEFRNKLYAFADHTAEAVYNSALKTFAQIPTSKPFIQKKPVDVRDEGNPFFQTGPRPLWVTVAGRNGFEPVAILNPGQPLVNPVAAGRQKETNSQAQPNFAVEYWPGWGYSFGIILLFCLTFSALMLFARRNGYPVVAMLSAQPDDYLRDDDYDPIPRAFYLFSTGMGLALLTTVWLVVPGVVVQQNLAGPAKVRLMVAEFGLPIAGALLVIALRTRMVARAGFRRRLHPSALEASPAGRIAFFAVSGSLFLTVPSLLMNPFPNSLTSTLPSLWLFLCFGCFCVGATFTASTLPVFNLEGFIVAATKDSNPNNSRWKSSLPYAAAAVLITLLIAALIGFAGLTIHAPAPADFLAAYRSLDLTNGVAPLVPLTFLFGALTAISVVQLRRMSYYEDRCPEVPGMQGDEFCPKLDGIVKAVKIRIRKITCHHVHYPVAVIAIVLLAGIFRGSAQTLERWPLEFLMLLSALSVAMFVLLVWIRLIFIWSAFAEFLQQLERHPIRQIFSLLPKGFVWSPIWQGGGKKCTHVAITRSLESMHALLNHAETPPSLKNAIKAELNRNEPDSLTACVKSLLETSAERRRFSRPQYRSLERVLREIAEQAAEYLRWAKWNRGDYELRNELATKEETKEALHTPRPEYLKQEPATICGELVAFRFLAFINFILWHIDNLVTYISVGFLLLVVALSSYAFRSRTIMDWLLVLLFAVLSAGIITIFAHLDRDAILSRITGTKEGKLDRHFVTHLVSYGAVPALVLLATHFPTIGKFFFSWVKPALEAIH